MDYGIGTCEGKIRVIEHRASKEIRGYHSLPPYNSQPTDTSKASKELFFWGHKIDLLKSHMVCFDKIPSLLYWDGNGGKEHCCGGGGD